MEIPRQPLMKIGDGIYSITHELRERAVRYTEIEKIELTEVGKIHKVEEIMKEVEDHETLKHIFNVSLGCTLMGTGVGGAAKMVYETRFYNGKKYYAVNIKKVVREKRLTQPFLVEEAMDVLHGQGIDRFHQIYGDRFVEGFEYGGEIYLVMQVSAKEKTSLFDIDFGFLNGALSLIQNIFNLEANAGYDYEKISQNLQVDLIIFQQGGQSKSQPRTIDALKDYVDKFLRDVDSNPVAISAITRSYDTLAHDYYVSLDSYIKPQKQSIELASHKILECENYLARLNQESFTQSFSQSSARLHEIYQAKVSVKEALLELRCWLDRATSIGGVWDSNTIPNPPIHELSGISFY
jgi:hypothetical protein